MVVELVVANNDKTRRNRGKKTTTRRDEITVDKAHHYNIKENFSIMVYRVMRLN